MNWKNQTAGGIPVVIYDESVQDNRPESYPIHGRVKLTNSLTGTKHWAPQAWTAPGRAFGQPHPLDLVAA